MHWLHRAANNSLSLDNVCLKLGHVQHYFNCDKMLGQNLIPKTITLLMNKILPGVQWHAVPIVELTLHWINGRNQSNWKSHVYHSQMYKICIISWLSQTKFLSCLSKILIWLDIFKSLGEWKIICSFAINSRKGQICSTFSSFGQV